MSFKHLLSRYKMMNSLEESAPGGTTLEPPAHSAIPSGEPNAELPQTEVTVAIATPPEISSQTPTTEIAAEIAAVETLAQETAVVAEVAVIGALENAAEIAEVKTWQQKIEMNQEALQASLTETTLAISSVVAMVSQLVTAMVTEPPEVPEIPPVPSSVAVVDPEKTEPKVPEAEVDDNKKPITEAKRSAKSQRVWT